MWPLLTLHRSVGAALHRVRYLWVSSAALQHSHSGLCLITAHTEAVVRLQIITDFVDDGEKMRCSAEEQLLIRSSEHFFHELAGGVKSLRSF